MGEIVYKTILRAFVLTLILWWVSRYIYSTETMWIIVGITYYFGLFLPGYYGYKRFVENNKETAESTLCTSCKHFSKNEVYCVLHDQFPTRNYLPCEGNDWEMTNEGDSD